MALVLKRAMSYSLKYKDASGAERSVRIVRGQDAEALGLPPHALEQLREASYGAAGIKYFEEVAPASVAAPKPASRGAIFSAKLVNAAEEAKSEQKERAAEVVAAKEKAEEAPKKAPAKKKAAPKKAASKKVIRKKAAPKKKAASKKAASKKVAKKKTAKKESEAPKSEDS